MTEIQGLWIGSPVLPPGICCSILKHDLFPDGQARYVLSEENHPWENFNPRPNSDEHNAI